MKLPCDKRCPNYSLPLAKLYCDKCGEGISNGDEFIRNLDGEYRHYDCFQGMRDLTKWLRYEIEVMEEDEY